MISPACVSIVWNWVDGGEARARLDRLAATTDSRCELVVVTPAASEGHLSLVAPRFDRHRTVASDQTLLAAFADALQACTGEWVVFLPHSAEPSPGWLEALLEVAALPHVAAVTPRLTTGDQTLSAAGSILWRDGTCEPYGRGDVPHFQEYAFRRDVPSAPIDALCVHRHAVAELGGLDGSFASSDYAVADLALRCRAAGYRVVYQPRAVVQLPGAGGAVSPTVAHEEDRETLSARHAEVLQRFPVRPAGMTSIALFAARDALCVDRMLIVDDRIPGADRGSGDPRMLRMVTDIAGLWPDLRLTFAAQRPIEPERYAPPLLDAGIEVIYGCPDWSEWFASRRYHYGIVMVSKPQPVAPVLRRTQPQAFRIYDAEALVFRRLERMLPLITDPVRAREVANQMHGARNAESDYLASADLVVCVSRDEQRTARAIAERVPTVIVPHRVETRTDAPGHAVRSGLLYFGGFMGGAGSPNEDALLYLVSEILPILHAHDPTLTLYVVGADPTPAVQGLASERVQVIGYVRDPWTWLSRTQVHIAPLRFGAGVKLKLIDTMAAGLPFVTTTVGAEGLRLGGLRPRLVADTPEALAGLTLELCRNAEVWTAAQRRLLVLATRHFGRARFQQALTEAMSYAGIAPPEPTASPA